QVHAQVLQLAEQTKRTLSDREQTEIVRGLPDGSGEVRRTLGRHELETMIEGIVERTIRPCRQALKDADIRAKDVTNVVAVGGSTRVPLVRRHIEALFGRPPLANIDPDQVVALGAGI